MSSGVIGYKGFGANLICREYQYIFGHTHKMDARDVIMCHRGFHFCRCPLDVFSYYNRNDDCYAIVSADDYVVDSDDGTKSVTNQLTILQVITRHQLEQLCTGLLYWNNLSKVWYPADQIPNPLPRMHESDCLIFYAQGQRHRDDGPAYINGQGCKIWYLRGKKHRDDGPAYEYADGSAEWYQGGFLHRIDGPAVDQVDGTKKWYLAGKVHRVGRPAIIRSDGSREWYANGLKHRMDGPAVEAANGFTMCFKHGQLQYPQW